MKLFSESVKHTNTNSAQNILQVKNFREIFFDVFEVEINKSKYPVEKISEFNGNPVVSVPVVIGEEEQMYPFVLVKGKPEILFNPKNTTFDGITPEIIEKPLVEKSTSPDIIELIDSLPEPEKKETRILESVKDKIASQIKNAKTEALKYAESIKKQKIYEANQEILEKKNALKDITDSARISLVEEFVNISNNIRDELYKYNTGNLAELQTNIDSKIEAVSNDLSASLSEDLSNFIEEFDSKLESLVTEMYSKIVDIKLDKELKEIAISVVEKIDAIDSALDLKLRKKVDLEVVEKVETEIDAVRKGNIELHDTLKKGVNKALSRIGLVDNKVGELTIAVSEEIDKKIDNATTHINQVYEEKLKELEEQTFNLNENFRQYVENGIKESKENLISEIRQLKDVAPIEYVIEAKGKKEEKSWDTIEKDWDKKIDKISNEMVKLKKYVTVYASGGGTNAVQYANGGIINGDLIITGSLSAGNFSGGGSGGGSGGANPVKTVFVGDGITTDVAITGADGISNPAALDISIDGAVQEPYVDYNLNNNVVTFTSPVLNGARAVIIAPNMFVYGLSSISLDEISDVNIVGTPTNGQALVWSDSLSSWTNGASVGGGGDYLPLSGGTLTGNLSVTGTTYSPIISTYQIGNNVTKLDFPISGNANWYLPGAIIFHKAGTGQFAFGGGSGNWSNNHLYGLAHNNFDLGLPSNYWRNGYITTLNTTTLSATGGTSYFNNVYFGTNTNPALRGTISVNGAGTLLLNSSNIGGVTVYGPLLPSATGTDLGDSTKRWDGFFRSIDIAETTLAASGALSGSALNIEQTWATTGAPTSILLNVTDSGTSQSTSKLIDLQVGGVSKFSVNKDGEIRIGQASSSASQWTVNGIFIGTSQQIALNITTGISLLNARGLTFSGTGGGAGFFADSANALAQRNGVASQTFRIYNTYTSATSAERGFLKWENNVFKIGTETLPSSANNRSMEFVTASSTRMTILSSGKVGIGTTTPVALLEVSGGMSSGTDGNYDSGIVLNNTPNGLRWKIASGIGGVINSSFSIGVPATSPYFVIHGSNSAAYGNAGNVGIGSNVAYGKLSITDTVNAASGGLSGNALNISQTWATTGAPTSILLNVTDSGTSQSSSKLIDLQVGGVSKFKVDKGGNIEHPLGTLVGNIGTNSGFYNIDDYDFGYKRASSPMVRFGFEAITLGNTGKYKWSSTSSTGGTPDLGIARNTAGILEVNNGTAGQYRDLVVRNLSATGDFEISTVLKGIILHSPNNTRYRITVTDAGALSTVAL